MTTVSKVGDVRQARFVESVESAHTNQGTSAMIKEMLKVEAAPVRMDSQAKYAALATGMIDVYLRLPRSRADNYRENVWDHAAGHLIVEEAGGKVTDINGHPLDWTRGRKLENNLGVVATNGLVHESVIDALKSVS